ncbi:hypothetical protein PENSPDRAFT_691000 [Peniophora sp. CONT]|nr:hypothetical protein PENSPDRAFT_691000 [Peniophora sp. CONT]
MPSTVPYICGLDPPVLPKPLSEIYLLPTFQLPTSLEDVRECFRLLGDIEAHALRNPALLRTSDIAACRAWAALVARNIEVPITVEVVPISYESREHRHQHKKSASKTSNPAPATAILTKRPSRSPSEPAPPRQSMSTRHTSPPPPVPALIVPPSHDIPFEKPRPHSDEVRNSRDTRARIHAVVEEEVQPLRDKLALLQAHVQTIKHKRSARSVKTARQAQLSADESLSAPVPSSSRKEKERERLSIPQDFQMADSRGRAR